MSKSNVKHDNPYRDGSAAHKLFGAMKAKQVFTRGEVLAFAEENGIKAPSASAMVSALTSPRIDDVGHPCAKGEVYYMEKLARKVVDGKKQKTKFRLRWHDTAGEKVESEKVKVDSEEPELDPVS